MSIRSESADTPTYLALRAAIGGTRWLSDFRSRRELLDRGNFDVDEIGFRLSGTLQPKNAGAVVGDGEWHV